MGVIKREIGERDIEKAQILLKDVMSGINDGPIPLVVVDEMHAIESATMAEDIDFQRFLNWSIFLSDHCIANVVFVSRDNVVLKLDGTNPTFRQRRVHFPINLPDRESVRDELKLVRERNEGGLQLSTSLPMCDKDADYVVDTFGDQLKDIETLLNRIQCTSRIHHNSVGVVGSQLVRDTVTFIDSVVRELLEGATDREGCKRVIRFWDLLRLLVAKRAADGSESVSRGELAAKVFKRRSFEIERYVDLGIGSFGFLIVPQVLRKF